MTGLAYASPADEERDDTVFNYGYDEEAGLLLWSINATDGTYDCSLGDDSHTATYTVDDEGLVIVEDLLDSSGDPVAFDPTDEADLADGLDPASEPVEYGGAEGDCVIAGGPVAGPNGQINHGMFMKFFNSMFEGQGRGCLNRYLAQSDLGKGDQQVKVGDVAEDAEPLVTGDQGTVDFESVLADCERGNGKDKSEEAKAKKAEKAEERAQKAADKAAKPKGKSADAPGRNK